MAYYLVIKDKRGKKKGMASYLKGIKCQTLKNVQL